MTLSPTSAASIPNQRRRRTTQATACCWYRSMCRENMNVSVLPPPLTVTTSLPPLVEYDAVAPVPTPRSSILSVVEKPEITACSPSPLLAIDSDIERVAAARECQRTCETGCRRSNSTVPPPLSTYCSPWRRC